MPTFLRLQTTFEALARIVWVGLVVSALSGAVAHGQAASQISGTTKDVTGAVIPGVEVTATQTDTGLNRTVMTDAGGLFVFPDLPTGPYRLEATKAGFQKFVQTGIQLQVGASPVIPVLLSVGEVSQSVEVSANASSIETEKLGVGTVMENQRVLELPLNGRNLVDMVALTPGAVQTGTSPVWSMQTGSYYSVGGGQNYGVYYSVDGAPYVHLYDATNLPYPFPDALQEFKVSTSTQGAAEGMHSGGGVSGVVKSGTNAFHGDAFEFLRNGALDARNFFAAQTDTLKRNQFGGVIGGPILKNKLFFFVGYEGTTVRQSPISTVSFVPTAAMEAGDFTAYESAACQGTNKTLPAPFVNNRISASLLSPQALAIASKLPQTSDPCGRYLTGNLVSQYLWQVPARFDYQLSAKHFIFGRYLANKVNQVVPFTLTPNNLLTTNANGADDLFQSSVLGDTYLISPTTVNSFHISVNRIAEIHPGATFLGPSDVGINAYSYITHSMDISVTGGPTVGGTVQNNLNNFDTYSTINDDVSLIRGAHQIAFGGDVTLGLVDAHFNVRSTGNFNFAGVAASSGGSGQGMVDFLRGTLSTFRESSPNPLIVSQRFMGLYAQDTWKVTQRLTLNYGLRWEPFFPQNVKNKSVYSFSVPAFEQGLVSKVYTNAPAGLTYPGDTGFNDNSAMSRQLNDLQPRVGLAWDPKGDGKTAIRAGAGIAYDFVNMQLLHNSVCFAPFCDDTTVQGPISLANPWATTPGGDPFPTCCPSSPPHGVYPIGAAQYMPIAKDIKTPEQYTWNVAIQRQVTPSWFTSASYVGSQAIHLWDLQELNPGVFLGTGPCTLSTPSGPVNYSVCSTTGNLSNRRLLNLQNPIGAESITYVTEFVSGGTQNYNGLMLNTTWRPEKNLSVNANYTWSHCIGDATIGGTVPNPGQGGPGLGLVVPNRALDRGNCVSDRRNILNLTVVGQSPRFANSALRMVGTGWTLSGIYRFSSGAPLSVLAGLDQALNGMQSSERANQVLPNTSGGTACGTSAPCVSWLNPAAFAQPALGTYGNIGALNVLGPNFWQFDMALTRQFAIHEGHHIELRGEAFNILNGVRFNNPAVALSSSSTFGRILSAQDPRILQLALKYVF